MANICRLIFSTNRLEYLIPTLASHEDNVCFGNHDVHTILIDDYPSNRFDRALINVSKKYNVNELILHEKNQGLTKTWTEAWEYLSTKNFDYIWHHEDDVVFFQPIEIDLLITFLKENPTICQVSLKRNPWYEHEINQPLLEPSDLSYKDYKFNLMEDYFWTMASLYPAWITKEPIVNTEKCNLGEWPVMKYLKEQFFMKMAILKNTDGSHMVEHIGNYSQGKRVLENEPGWDRFKYFDPMKRYSSKDGSLIE